MVVRFIANRTTSVLRLTNNAEYEVLRQAGNRYYVTNDNHSVQPYDVRLFDVITEDFVNNDTNELVEQIPAPARRRGRPTNAEINARRAAEAQQMQAPQRAVHQEPAPVETEAQRVAREAREEEERRGRIRTEEEIAETVIVRVSGNDATLHISFDVRERVNDAPSILTHDIPNFSIFGSNISCGIVEVGGVGNVLNRLHDCLDYQERDWEILRPALFRAVSTFLDNRISQSYRNGAYSLISVVTRYRIGNVETTHVDELINYFGYQRAIEDRVNTNSNNTISLLVKNR